MEAKGKGARRRDRLSASACSGDDDEHDGHTGRHGAQRIRDHRHVMPDSREQSEMARVEEERGREAESDSVRRETNCGLSPWSCELM